MVDSITESGLPVDWDYLRKEGLKHLQEMTGHLWTDFNVHDPGVTLFEALCYGIEELDARISGNIESILTDESGQLKSRFFSPGDILTINPVTINDYRKLLIDIPGVKNAWLEAVSDTDPDIYYDKDNNALLYDYAPKAAKIHLNGLYRVHIEKKDDVEAENSRVEAAWDDLSAVQKDQKSFAEWDLLSPADKAKLSADTWNGLTDDEKDLFAEQAREKFLDETRISLREEAEELLRKAVKKQLNAHRNLCEDFEDIRIMPQEMVYLYTDIQIDEDANENEVMGRIYYDLQHFISPGIRQYGLKRMLEKGKSVEQIFNGPRLQNGFVDDDELGSGQKRRELHTSDLIRIIMAHKEVKDVRNLFVANVPGATAAEKQEWALVLDDTKALVLEAFNSSRIRMFKHETLTDIDRNKVLFKVKALTEQAGRKAFSISTALAPAVESVSDNAYQYDAIGHKLPANLGISETGLPSSATPKRKAQARQLRGYLLFFEQILVNYLKQLESFKHLFAFHQNRGEILKTYFSKLLPESMWKGDFSEIEEGYAYLEDDPEPGAYQDENAFARKNRILNHLLAMFNERFADYSIMGYRDTNLDSGLKKPMFIQIKADFLKDYPRLSQNRNKAYDTLDTNDVQANINGLKDLIASKVGFDAHEEEPESGVELINFHVVEHILLRPRGRISLDFICSEHIGEEFQPDPYSYKLTFIIPTGLGRFKNSAFKKLVYDTIKEETPAHISYQVLEFEAAKLKQFRTTYHNYLDELKRIQELESDQYNTYRNALVELLELGQIKLPVMHLDATDYNGDGEPDYDYDKGSNQDDESDDANYPADGESIGSWYDLSRNENHATGVDGSSATYVKNDPEPPYLRFANSGQFKIKNNLIETSFTLALIFKVSGHDGAGYTLLSGNNTGVGHISVKIHDSGVIEGNVNQDLVSVDSSLDTSHILIFSGDKDSGKLELTIDGEEYKVVAAPKLDMPLDHQGFFLGDQTSSMSCEFGEIIVLDSTLTGARKRKLEEYLARKWRVALSSVQSVRLPRIHLDANDLKSVTSDVSTGKISRWNDLSNYGTKAGQVNPALQPLYNQSGLANRPSVEFKGSNSLVIDSSGQSILGSKFSLGIIYRANESDGILLSSNSDPSSATAAAFEIRIGKMGAILVNSGEEIKVSSCLFEAHFIIVTGELSGTNLDVTVHLDGKLSFQHSIKVPGSFAVETEMLGIGGKLKGDIGEVVIFDDILTVLERQRLEDFFSRKWRVDTTGVNPVTKPVVHLDATRLTTITEEFNTDNQRLEVKQWNDISPYGNHAVQNASMRRPVFAPTELKGMGAIRFDQIRDSTDTFNDTLSVKRTIKNDFTIFAIFKPDFTYYTGDGSELSTDVDKNTQWTEGAAVVDADCSGIYNDFGISVGRKGDKMIVMAGIGDRNVRNHTIHSEELAFDAVHLITFTRTKSDGEVRLYANGMLHVAADLKDDAILNDSRYINIGAFSSDEGIPFRGHVGEVIILDHVLTDAKRQQIEKYLSFKWSIPIKRLPINTDKLWLHFDANERDTVITNIDHKIPEWEDTINATKLSAIQSDAKLYPQYIPESINGMPGIRFNNSKLDLAEPMGTETEFTLAVVYNALSWGNVDIDWDYGAALIDNNTEDKPTGGFGLSTMQNPITGAYELSTRVGEATATGTFSLQSPQIAIVKGDADKGEVRTFINGIEADHYISLTSTVVLNPTDSLTIGSTHLPKKGNFHGDIAEIIYLKNELKTSERQILEKHLSQKWRIDISGVNDIIKPLFHLDASKQDTVIKDSATHAVEKWLDKNGFDVAALQLIPDKRPVHVTENQEHPPVIRFDGQYLTFPQMVEEDFSLIVVYRADADLNPDAYMPVSRDAFTRLAGVSLDQSIVMWNKLRQAGYFDGQGAVLAAFTPNDPNFALALGPNDYHFVQKAVKDQIISTMTNYKTLAEPIPREKFVTIGGINKELSSEIRQALNELNYLDNDGFVLEILPGTIPTTDPEKQRPEAFEASLQTKVIEAIVNVIRADNWFEGVGLIDGNSAGDRDDTYKRDFGLLVGKNDKLIGGVGVIGDADKKIEAIASKDEFHVAVLTRNKNSGLVTLTVDESEAVIGNFSRGVSLRDSQRLTIGAVNTGGNYFKGEIGEIIVVDRDIEENDIRSIQRYLAKKWRLDRPGLNAYAKPLLHLDASKTATVKRDSGDNTVEKWVALNSPDLAALQADNALRPIFVPGNLSNMPVIRFNNSFLTLPRLMENDFSLAVVFKADSSMAETEYMPVAEDSFERLEGMTSELSQKAWQQLSGAGYFDDKGNVLSSFNPNEQGFSLNVNPADFQSALTAIETKIIDIIIACHSSPEPVPKEQFATIKGITRALSENIWNRLTEMNFLDSDGNVTNLLSSNDPEFSPYLIQVFEYAMIDIILADNWFEGAGLIDGNSPGDIVDFYKQDFGLLIGRNNKILGGFGVMGEADKKVEAIADKDKFHAAVLTRNQETGLVTLTVDDNETVSTIIGPGAPVSDPRQITIGAVNTGGGYFKGDIGEIVILDKEISPSHKRSIIRYLSKKWKVA